MSIVPEKRCTRCGNPFPRTNEYFCKDKTIKDGLGSMCKECNRAKGREYYAKNKEKVLARVSAYDKAHPVQVRAKSRRHYYKHHDKELARARKVNAQRTVQKREWYLATIEDRKAYEKRYRDENKDKISQRGKDYYRKHPEKAVERYTLRRARELKAEGRYTKADVDTLYKSQKGCCWWCGKDVGDDYHVDHRIALTRGGSNWPDNLCISCPECNRSKGNKLPHEWNGRLL